VSEVEGVGASRSGAGGGRLWVSLVPAVLLLLGAGARTALHPGRELPLQAPLSGLVGSLARFGPSSEVPLDPASRSVLAADGILFRRYRPSGGGVFDVFVAYYGRQKAGSSIHSPRNCLPGSGWEPLEHQEEAVHTTVADGRVNRYLVEDGSGRRALVYYWYQGRGRIVADEYRVKWYLLRDAVLERRTDEALIRLVFAVAPGETADVVAGRTRSYVQRLASAMWDYLPPANEPGS